MRRTIQHAVFALTLAGCLLAGGGPGLAESPSMYAYSDNGYVILDPAKASLYRTNDERLIVAIQECLTVLDPKTGRAIPAAAESWSASSDRKVWTFKLRKNALWSDGSPVTSEDFLRSWMRVMDPFTRSKWSWLYRSIRGCGAITDNSARADGFVALRNGLKNLLSSNPNGIQGQAIIDLLEETGVKPFLVGLRSRSVKRILKWKSGDMFPPESARKVIDQLRKERRKVRDQWVDGLAAFGKAGSGASAPDAHTIVVKTQGDAPYLPELLARSAFAPLHKSVDSLRKQAFQAGDYVNNGPFMLKGRGAKPPEGMQVKRVMSVVHLVRNPKYNGPNKAQVEEIRCITDQSLLIHSKEDVYEFERGQIQLAYATWPEYPKKKLRKKIEGLKGYVVRRTPRVLYLRFRCDRPPFKDKAARMAFALSLNRGKLADRYWPRARPAMRIVPPGIEGRIEGISCVKANLNAARAAYASAGLDEETWVEVSYGESPGQDDVAAVLIKDWTKGLQSEPGARIESDEDVRRVVRSGAYYVMLTEFRGFANDPYAYLAPLHSKDADSGLGWRDEAFDTLIDAASDPDLALANADEFIQKTGRPELRSYLDRAKGSQDARAEFRRQVLASAERRLMEEFVVIPLLFLDEALLQGDVSGLGSDEARRNPGFVGSLIHAKR